MTVLIAWGATHLAQAEPLVGALPGDFSIDNKGAANYVIPLQIVPGRGSMQPQLALCYNSKAGNGLLGVGFSLSTGYPRSIERGRTILARDGVVSGAKFDNSDKLYLDGKRLICVSGTHGMPGSVYRTEVDSFVTITAFGSGDNIEGFRLMDKNGTMLCFGKNVMDAGNALVYPATDGYQMLAGETTDKAYAWALKWVEDAVGNYIEFCYDEWFFYDKIDFENILRSSGEHLLVSVKYTGNRKQAISPSQTITFHHNELNNASGFAADYIRPDGGIQYRYGRHKIVHARLDRISTAAHDYKLQYEPASIYNEVLRLERVSLDVGGSSVFTDINWGKGFWEDEAIRHMEPEVFHTQGKYYFSYGRFSGDFKGDGRTERIAPLPAVNPDPNTKTLGMFDGTTERTIVLNGTNISKCALAGVGDFNGDGRTDIVLSYRADGQIGGGWYVALSTGTDFSTPVRISINHNNFLNTYNKCAGYPFCFDMDGDGLDEILVNEMDMRPPRGSLSLTVQEDAFGNLYETIVENGDGATFMPGGLPLLMSPRMVNGAPAFTESLSGTHGGGGGGAVYQKADFDGDGKADNVIISSFLDADDYYGSDRNFAYASHSIGLYLNPPISTPSPASTIIRYRGKYVHKSPDLSGGFMWLLGDVNGDGLDDLVVFRKNDLNGENDGWTVYLSKGDGTFDSSSFSGIPLTTESGNPTYTQVEGCVRIGSSYTEGGSSYYVEEASDLDISGAVLMDVNADGRKDFVYYENTKNHPAGRLVCILAGPSGFRTGLSRDIGGWRFENLLPQIWPSGTIPPAGTAKYVLDAADMEGRGRDGLLFAANVPAANAIMRITFPQSYPNLVHFITNAFGETTKIAYAPITSDNVYTAGTPVTYPIREDRRPQHVVSDIYKDTGATSSSERAHFSYQYSGNRTDLSGRGPLGFHSFVTLDRQTNFFKYQFLTQSFPMTGLTKREQTYRYWNEGGQSKFRLISSHDNTVVFDEVVNPANNTAWGTVYPFISRAVESRWEDSEIAHYTFAPSSVTSQPETIFTRANPAGAHITIQSESLFDNQTAVQTTLPGSYQPSDITQVPDDPEE